MNEERVQELMNEVGLSSRYGEYIIPAFAYKSRMIKFAELVAEECEVCDKNWRSLAKQYDPLTNRRFICDGEEYTFVGLLRGSDDYYFCMYDKLKDTQFYSCVCNLDTYGFVLIEDGVKKK